MKLEKHIRIQLKLQQKYFYIQDVYVNLTVS